MKKLVIAGSIPFSEEQIARLEALTTVETKTDFDSDESWLQAVLGADIIISDGSYLVSNLDKLENVFVTYPFVELGSFDTEVLKEKGVMIANSRGGNRDSIVEWVIFMVLEMYRQLTQYINIDKESEFKLYESLAEKKVLIVGKGSIGTRIGEVCTAFNMNVNFYTREDDLVTKSADVDLVINALSCTPSSENLLSEQFFMSLKPGARFISFSRQHTYDLNGMMRSLDENILQAAAIDCDPEEPFDVTNDFYRKCLQHQKVLVTPHIAFSTEEAIMRGREVMVKNIESYIAGEPQNIVVKK